MRALALVLLAALLVGCSESRPAQFGEAPPCFLATAQAEWMQADLFDALPLAAERAGVELERRPEGYPEIRLDHETLSRWREPTIESLAGAVGNASGTMWLSPSLVGEWQLSSSVTWENETLARYAQAFLDDVGLGEHPERAAWLFAMNASRGRDAYPEARLVAEPALPALLDRLGEGNLTEGGIGNARIRWDGWEVDVGFGTRMFRSREGASFDLVVDETGRALAHTSLTEGEDPSAVFHARANSTFARLGLALPEFGPIRGGYGGC